MKQTFLLFITLTMLLLTSMRDKDSISKVHMKNKRILFVCTNVDQLNGKPNGTYLVEIAAPIYLLNQAGCEIDIVSPLGGPIPIYHKGDTSLFLKKAIQIPTYKIKTKDSLTPEQVDVSKYDAVIIPGGYGQFWDLHTHQQLLNLVASIYNNKGFIGSIGHGTSTLSQVKLANNSYLVKNKTLTCFPSWFERKYMSESQFGKLLPFDMEKVLVEHGAKLMSVDSLYSNKTVTDRPHRIITAAFANDADYVAKEMIKLLTHE